MLQKEKIKVGEMVWVTIEEEQWIGQVVDLFDEKFIVQLLDNIHYMADSSELRLFNPYEHTKI